MDLRGEIIFKEIEFWDKLLTELGTEDLRVLEIINDNETITLDSLIKELKLRYKLDFSKNKVRKIIFELKGRELLILIKSVPLFISQVKGIEEDIKKLIILGKERYKLK
jgi:hypothetical protein